MDTARANLTVRVVSKVMKVFFTNSLMDKMSWSG